MTPIRRRTATLSATTSDPATHAWPEVRVTRVVRMPMVVVLPAPFGPSRPKNSPRRISRSRPWSATMPAGAAADGVPGAGVPDADGPAAPAAAGAPAGPAVAAGEPAGPALADGRVPPVADFALLAADFPRLAAGAGYTLRSA